MLKFFIPIMFLLPHLVLGQMQYPWQEIDSLATVGNYALAFRKNTEYISAMDDRKDCLDIPMAFFKSGELLDLLKRREESYRFFRMGLTSAKQCQNDSVEWLITRYLGGFFYSPATKDSALFYLNKAYDMIKDKNWPRQLSSTTGMLGETWYKLFLNKPEGERWFKISLEYALRSEHYHPIGYAYFRYGSYLLYNGNCDEGLPMLEKAFEQFSKNKDAEGEMYLLEGLIAGYKHCHKSELALPYVSPLLAKKDSLFNNEIARQTAQYETQFETEKKEQAIKVLQAEASLRQQQIIFIVSASLMIVAGFFFYQNRRALKLRLKMNEDELKLKLAHNQEIERISKELHDNVGSNLSLMISNIDYLHYKEKLSGLNKISDTARNTLQQLRETIWATDKSTFTIQDFRNKVEQFIGQLSDNGQPIKFSLDFPNISIELKPGQVLNLFRIVQEAVVNSIKHSGTKEISIELKHENDKLILTVSDKGKGFDLHQEFEGHYGLVNIRKRATALNAELWIESVMGKGSSISLKMASGG
jgi:signal transduction histidine kinase